MTTTNPPATAAVPAAAPTATPAPPRAPAPVAPQVAAAVAAYTDPVRKVGSQSEVPGMTLANGVVSVTGYQKFKLTGQRIDRAGLGRKYISVMRYLEGNRQLTGKGSSFLDIGCSAGMLCFLAKDAGFDAVTGLDHDPEYITLLKAASITSGVPVNGIVGSWRGAPHKYDVVAALALIHWIYSMTATEGSFENIFGYLAEKADKLLLIEWVDPADPAITKLKHISANKETQKEPYELARFIAAGELFFGPLDARIDVNPTRCIYVFRKEQRVRGHSAVVRFTSTAVVKSFRDHIVRSNPAMIERERKALATLDGIHGVPALLGHTEREFYLSNCGAQLAPSNIPADAEKQGTDLVATINRKGVRHNDIHPHNILVKDGRLHLIDFAWASIGGEATSFLNKDIGVAYGVRKRDEPFDDQVMMARSLEIVRKKAAG